MLFKWIFSKNNKTTPIRLGKLQKKIKKIHAKDENFEKKKVFIYKN